MDDTLLDFFLKRHDSAAIIKTIFWHDEISQKFRVSSLKHDMLAENIIVKRCLAI